MVRSPHDPLDEAAAWVARRSDGVPSGEDQRNFFVWLNASAANREAFDHAQTLWEQLRGADQIAARELTAARSYLAKRRQFRSRLLAVAAVLVLGIAVIWVVQMFFSSTDQIFQTAIGERETINLTDGTVIELNTNSEVRVLYSRESRRVDLTKGQALFTVAHQPFRPFLVATSEGIVRDIGTQFEVRQGKGHVAVAVLDGAVEIKPSNNTPQTIPLRRGSRLTFNGEGHLSDVEGIDINSYAAWRTGEYVFQNQALEDVIEELRRYNTAEIEIRSSGLSRERVSGRIPCYDLNGALKMIAAVLPIRVVRINEHSWQIHPR